MATRRSSHRRSMGQSLPLIALMIVVLVAMVGLSVDVGNTFNEERQAVSAANAASLSAMNVVLRRGDGTKTSQVYKAIIDSLQANGVLISEDGIPTDGNLLLRATYIDGQGKPIGSISANDESTVPLSVSYVQIDLQGIVNTYFAQVVGRPDLPINASAYAGQCALGAGVYPIGIDQSLLDANGFVQNNTPDVNWRVISDPKSEYRGRTARRVFVHDGSNQPGSFGFLRWKEDKGELGKSAISAQELGASLSGFGNLSWGFDEADEPKIGNQPLDPNYPKLPGEINEGDWVWGTPGWKAGGADDPLDEHMDVGTKMILPLYNMTVDNGSNAKFRVSGFATFVIIGREGKNDNLKGNGKKYYDLVYIGPATRQTTACQFSPVPPNDADCCRLWGEVSLLPEYQIQPKNYQPIQYVVVLDQSGSMAANFKGQCDAKFGNGSPPARKFTGEPSAFWQCANGPLYDSNGDGVGDTAVTDRVTGTGSTYYWGNRDERRITVAKKALETLIKLTNMPSNSGYNNAYPDDQMALLWFTDKVNRDGNNERFVNGKNYTSNRDELIDAMWDRTTSSRGDIYLSEGGTNGAAGLYRAFLVLNGMPKEIVHQATNTKYKYKQVVLFITDGVSNQFFHESESDLQVLQSDDTTYPGGSPCRNLGFLVIEDAECQTSVVGGTIERTLAGKKVTLDRPVTQAVSVSQNFLQKNGYLVFVIALSELPATGLAGGIPSFPNYYKAVPRLIRNADGTTNVDSIVKEIHGIVDQPRCQQGKDTSTTGTITAGQYAPVVLKNGQTMTYPNVGVVTIKNTVSNVSYTTFMKAGTDGKVTYNFEKVPPGIYTMTATVYYKHPLDPAGVVRAYNDFFTGTDNESSISVEVSSRASNSGLLPTTQKNISMRLRGDVCAGAGVGGN